MVRCRQGLRSCHPPARSDQGGMGSPEAGAVGWRGVRRGAAGSRRVHGGAGAAGLSRAAGSPWSRPGPALWLSPRPALGPSPCPFRSGRHGFPGSRGGRLAGVRRGAAGSRRVHGGAGAEGLTDARTGAGMKRPARAGRWCDSLEQGRSVPPKLRSGKQVGSCQFGFANLGTKQLCPALKCIGHLRALFCV